jgi:hypothetical protein
MRWVGSQGTYVHRRYLQLEGLDYSSYIREWNPDQHRVRRFAKGIKVVPGPAHRSAVIAGPEVNTPVDLFNKAWKIPTAFELNIAFMKWLLIPKQDGFGANHEENRMRPTTT